MSKFLSRFVIVFSSFLLLMLAINLSMTSWSLSDLTLVVANVLFVSLNWHMLKDGK